MRKTGEKRSSQAESQIQLIAEVLGMAHDQCAGVIPQSVLLGVFSDGHPFRCKAHPTELLTSLVKREPVFSFALAFSLE